jgi:hypothetical protein
MVEHRRIHPAGALALAAALGACASMPDPTQGPASRPEAEEERLPHVADYTSRLQCVPFARRLSGIEIYGDAYTWWAQAEGRYPRSGSPAPGAVLVMHAYRSARRGHVAVVTSVESSRLIRVDHANWLNAGEISVSVPVLDVSPANDWSEVRVWHIPGGHWGGRVYRAQGFIHPFRAHAATS